MESTGVAVEFDRLERPLSTYEYNYTHFRTWHLLRDMRRTLSKAGVQPGQLAPDFELRSIDGGLLRLSQLRGRPVVLHFGSYS